MGYEGRYEVSSAGEVRSLMYSNSTRPQVLKERLTQRGYARVGLGRRDDRYIHRIVAEAFLGPLPDGYQVNHLDGDKRNNTAANLEYVTPRQNYDHAVARWMHARGSACGPAKLTEEQVKRIRSLYPGHDQYELAEMFGVEQTTISMLLRRKTWRHVS